MEIINTLRFWLLPSSWHTSVKEPSILDVVLKWLQLNFLEQELLKSVVLRIRRTLDQDVFLPLYPKRYVTQLLTLEVNLWITMRIISVLCSYLVCWRTRIAALTYSTRGSSGPVWRYVPSVTSHTFTLLSCFQYKHSKPLVVCVATGQHRAVGWCLIHVLSEGPGIGQHPQQIHPLCTADHRHWGGQCPEMPEGRKHSGCVTHHLQNMIFSLC